MSQNSQFDYILFLRSQKISVIVSRLLLAVMVTCLAIPLIMIGEQILPDWSGGYLLLVVFLVLLESFYSHYRLRKVRISEGRWWMARGAQLIVIFLLGKLAMYLSEGFDQLLLDIQLWRSDFLRAFFDIPTLVTFVIAFLVWSFGGELDILLYEIEGDERIFLDYEDAGYSEQRSIARQRLGNLVIVIGGIMIVSIGILSLGSSAGVQQDNLVNPGIYALLVYFLCGLILLGLSQFALLRVRWILNRVEIDRKVVTHWTGLGLGLTVIVAILASLLPTEYSGQLLRVLQIMFYYILNILLFIASLFMTPFILFFGWLMNLFRGERVNVQPPRRIEIPAELFATPSSPPNWLELLKSILFWSILIGLLVYALIYYFKEHPDYFNWLRSSKWYLLIRQFWQNLRLKFGWFTSGVSKAITERVSRLRPIRLVEPGQRMPIFFNPRRYGARQQVIFYYLALIKKGEQKGIYRNPAQTPNEYSEKLGRDLNRYSDQRATPEKPETDEQVSEIDVIKNNLSGLTEGFIEARYSNHEITLDRASLMRIYWEHILHWLRRS